MGVLLVNNRHLNQSGRTSIAVLALLLVGCWTDIPYTGPFETAEYNERPSATVETAADSNEQSSVQSNQASVPNPFRQPSPTGNETSNTTDEESNVDPSVAAFDPFLDDDLFANAESMLEPTATTERKSTDEANGSVSEVANITPITEDGPPPPAATTPPLDLPKIGNTDSEIPFLDLPGNEPDEPSQPNSRQAAWLLGTVACRAALETQTSGGSPQAEADWQEAGRLAEVLGVQLPQTEPKEEDGDATKVILKVLLPLGRELGKELISQYDREHVALFEVAFKSTLLTVVYSPESPLVNSVADAIKAGCEKAALPSDLWSPLLDTLAQRPDEEIVDLAVSDFHSAVSSYLAQ